MRMTRKRDATTPVSRDEISNNISRNGVAIWCERDYVLVDGSAMGRTTNRKGRTIMAKTEKKCTKTYLPSADADVEKTGTRSWNKDATVLQFAFENGEKIAVNPNDFPEEMRVAFMFFGVSEKLGNAYASSKDADDAWEKFESLREQIMAGNWVSERESAGPRISLMIKAIVAAKLAQGVTVTEADVAAKYAALDKDGKAQVAKDPFINAEYQKLRAQEAMARAQKAADATKDATPSTGGLPI